MNIVINHNHRFNQIILWLITATIGVLAAFGGAYHNSKSVQAAQPFDIANMKWGLEPLNQPDGSFPNYFVGNGQDIGNGVWEPDPEENPFMASDATLAKPFVPTFKLNAENTRNNGIGPDATLFVNGFRLGANPSLMSSTDPSYDTGNSRVESQYFHYSVQEVTRTGQPVPNSGLKVLYVFGTSEWPMIYGFDQMVDTNDLAEVTVTPLDNAKGKLFTGSQKLYFSIDGDLTPVAPTYDWVYSYSTNYSENKVLDVDSMDPNGADSPIKIGVPDQGKLYLDAIAATVSGVYGKWSSDNSKLSFAPASNGMGEVVSGLDTLDPGTVVKFTATLNDNSTEDFYFQFGDKAPVVGKEVPFRTDFPYEYQAGGYWDNLNDRNPGPNWFPSAFGPDIEPNDDMHGTQDQPIKVELPKDYAAFNYGISVQDFDIGDDSLPISVDSKYGLTVTHRVDNNSYTVTGFDNLASGTKVSFKVTYPNGDYSLIYITFTRPVPVVAGTIKVNYVDDDNNGAIVKTDTIKGNVGDTGNYKVDVPTNYQMAGGQTNSLAYTIQNTNSDLTVHLKHQTETVNKTTKMVINYQGAGSATPATKPVDINWTGVLDKVTNKTSWSTTNLPITVDTPTINGYTPDHSTVTIAKVTGQSTEPTDQTITVKYTAKPVTPSNSGGGAITVNPGTPSNNNGNGGNSSWNPTTPTNPNGTGLPNYAAVKGSAVYATKKIYMYRNVNFNKSERIATYPKAKRTNRPMFVVIGYDRSNSGALRYKVRDVNHGKKTAGKIGYITANRKYVVNVYYKTMPKNNKITVISKKGVHAYKNVNLTGKAKTYKNGTHLRVRKIVKHNLTTRYQLTNGYYITANKKLVIHGNY